MTDISLTHTKVRVLMVIEAEIATTQIVERILIQCGRENLEYEVRLLGDLKISDFHPKILPLFIRCGDPLIRYWVRFLRIIGLSYIYYIDDNFWRIDGCGALACYYRHPLIRRALCEVSKNAELIVTNTENLSDFLAPFNSERIVLPAPFDFSLLSNWPKERIKIPEPMDAQIAEDHEFRIGFAGSSSRLSDVESILVPVVECLLSKYPELIFEFAGVELKHLKNHPRVRFFHHINSYAKFLDFKMSRNWKIGLAPLPNTEANRAKTNNKYREYSACGIAGVYSAVEPYLLCVEDGQNGVLVENVTAAWCAGISRLIDSPELLRKIRDAAMLDVHEKYAVEVVAPKWLAVFREKYKKNESPRLAISLLVRAQLLLFKVYLWLEQVFAQIQTTYKGEGVLMVVRRVVGRVLRFIFH